MRLPVKSEALRQEMQNPSMVSALGLHSYFWEIAAKVNDESLGREW